MSDVENGATRRSYESAIVDLNNLQTNAATLEMIRKSRGALNRFSLPEMTAFLEKLGYEPSHFNKLNVIHVSGTKGKGSTCAFVNSILRNAGIRSVDDPSGARKLKVGLYTSPHLVEVRERICIDGKPITHEMFAKYFYAVWDKLKAPEPPLRLVSESSPQMPMYFMYLTLMCLHVFLQEKVDVAILEVGMGGEYDNTNIVPRPVVCGVTSLGLDHQYVLGETLPEIAYHKGGIAKPGVPLFCVPQNEDALQVVRNR
ncbi:Folylpolyglutamate synthetase, partial [Spiromyces aspiralis]